MFPFQILNQAIFYNIKLNYKNITLKNINLKDNDELILLIIKYILYVKAIFNKLYVI